MAQFSDKSKHNVNTDDHRLHKPEVVGSSPTAAIPLTVKYDLPADDYFAHPSLGSTNFKKFANLPASLRAGNQEASSSLDSHGATVGTHLHDLLHDADEYGKNTVVADPSLCNADGSLSKRKSKEFLESLPEGKRVVTHKVAHDVARCFDELMNNSLAWSLYTERTHAEVSIFFELNGLGCKCRPDMISMGGILVDYKCTRKKDVLKTFPSVVREFQYGLSEALYIEGCRLAGIAAPPMHFIVFSLANFECQVMTLPRSYVRSEHDRLLRLIEDYQRRQETGDWDTREGYGTVHEMQMFSNYGGMIDG